MLIQRNQEYLDSFLFALKTTETKRQYSRNLKLFFDFGFESHLPLEEQARLFVIKGTKDVNCDNCKKNVHSPNPFLDIFVCDDSYHKLICKVYYYPNAIEA